MRMVSLGFRGLKLRVQGLGFRVSGLVRERPFEPEADKPAEYLALLPLPLPIS